MLKGHNTFEIIFLVGFVVGSVIRNIYMARCRGVKDEKKCSNVLDFILVSSAGVGLIMPLLYLFTSWFDFANYNLPGLCGWVGTAVFAGAFSCFGDHTPTSVETGRRRCELRDSTRS